MSLTGVDSNDINTVLHWAMGHRARRPGGAPVTDETATEAARRLAAKAHKALYAGLRPEQVQLTRAVSEASRACEPGLPGVRVHGERAVPGRLHVGRGPEAARRAVQHLRRPPQAGAPAVTAAIARYLLTLNERRRMRRWRKDARFT